MVYPVTRAGNTNCRHHEGTIKGPGERPVLLVSASAVVIQL